MDKSEYQNIAMRPMVDPDAEGAVNLDLYPEPQAKPKSYGKEWLETIFGSTETDLRIIKIFYFFFYSAFGSLFPLMGVYFKQMGLSPSQCGLLVGARPFVEFFSCSFWGKYAERTEKGKGLFLASLLAWIVFTVPIGFIQPPATSCLGRVNQSHYTIRPIGANERESRISGDQMSYGEYMMKYVGLEGHSPLTIEGTLNYSSAQHNKWVVPIFSSNVYRVEDIQRAFLLLFLLVIVGEFFSAPAITLADTAVLSILGDNMDKYGHQRMFGSIGWGISMFIMGIALDNSVSFPNHPCGAQKLERNYTICFVSFAVLMGAAVVSASQIKYPTHVAEPSQGYVDVVSEEKVEKDIDQVAVQLNLPSLVVSNTEVHQQSEIEQNKDQTKVFAQTNTEIPNIILILTQLKDPKCFSVLLLAWFMGFGIGLIFTFLFWHLQDYGGNPTLFGIASIINHVSEILAYFFSIRLIKKIGHVKVLCLGLIGNIFRFLIISVVKNAWWVLPFELVQGITHAAVWAACCSYLAHNTPVVLRNACQGVLQCLHHGLGRGCGAVLGGFLADSVGSAMTFRIYGFASLLVLIGFIFLNFYRKDQGFISEIPYTEDPHQVAEETSHLAPHGVPSNPLPKVLSNTKLNEMSQVQNNFYQQGSENISDAQLQNPFRNNY